MVSIDAFRKIALSFDNVTEQPHFEKQSFRIGSKIFATLDEKAKRVVVKLSEVDQSVFCTYDSSIIYPVPGKWGLQGWTMIELSHVPKSMLKDALQTAHQTLASDKGGTKGTKP